MEGPPDQRTGVSEPAPRRRASLPLLNQFGPVALGVAFLGLGSFAYLGVTGRALGPVGFAPVATLWVLFNSAGLALFQPVEQELSRATAARRALDQGARPVFLKATVYAIGVLALCSVAAFAAADALTRQAFNGAGVLVPLLVGGMVGLAAEHVLRGAFAGNGQFGRYGAQLMVDGALRIVGPVLLALTATTDVGLFALALVLAPLLAAVLTMGRLGALGRRGPAVPWRDVVPPFLVLTGAAVLSQLIVNAAPVAAQLLAGAEEVEEAGILIGALVLTRIPLFFFGAVQPAFLPSLSGLAAQGRKAAFAGQLRMVLLLVGGVAGMFVLGMLAVGPAVLQLLYGPEFVAGRTLLVPLAFAAALYMVAQIMAQVLVALQEYRAALVGWAAGSVAFFLLLLVPWRLELRVGGAFLVGSLVALAALTLSVRRSYRRLTEHEPSSDAVTPNG